MLRELLNRYDGDNERVGFILDDGSIVEVENICSDPQNGFEVRAEDLLKFEDRIQATWHTHPNESSNLSTNDLQSYLNYPDWKHYIVGNNGISAYEVRNGKVICSDVSTCTEA